MKPTVDRRLTPEQATMVEENLGLVRWVIRNVPPNLRDDRYQSGVIGLARAAQLYNPEKGSFASIAVSHIRSAIKNENGLAGGINYRRSSGGFGTGEYIEPISIDADSFGPAGMWNQVDESWVDDQIYGEQVAERLDRYCHDDLDRTILADWLNGLHQTNPELGAQYNLSPSHVSKRRNRVKRMVVEHLGDLQNCA